MAFSGSVISLPSFGVLRMYALATRLVGFRADSLRVRIVRTEGSNVWVRTADLLDSGTPLVLDASQIEPEATGDVLRHHDGLVVFA